MKKFKVGDQVVLKSGGPTMTVDGAGGEYTDIVSCKWFVGHKLQDGDFQPDALEPAPKEEKKG